MTTRLTNLFWCEECQTYTESNRKTKLCRLCRGVTSLTGWFETERGAK